ncbi:MAG: hypothetical protein K9L73_03565 [Spirochaetia bacterium]|nr:hypothetical protein [Spirochaetia bacterium]
MNTFYIDLLSIFFLFLTSLTCFFALFGKKGLYWVLPWIAASILTFIRVLEFRAPEASFVQLTGSDLYIEMLTPVALLTLFLSSLLLRFGLRRAHLFYASQIERQQSVPKVPAVPAVPPAAERAPAAESALQLWHAPSAGAINSFFTSVMAQTPVVKVPLSSPFFYILGIKHCGKSTIGRRAAELCGFRFYDLDALMLSFCRHSPFSGMSIREIYRSIGKKRFMLLELITFRQFLDRYESITRGRVMPVVLALGGGVCENTSLISLLQHTGSLIYLRAPEYTLYTRIRKGGIPPFLDPQQPKESFHELYEYRDACYRACCDTIMPLGDLIGIEEASVLLQQTMDSIHGDSHEQ